MRLANLLIIGSALFLAACNSVKGDPLPTAPSDPKLVEIGKALSEDDKKLLAGYLMRRELAKSFGGAEGLQDGVKTVGDALDAQKKWTASLTESQQKAEALKA